MLGLGQSSEAMTMGRGWTHSQPLPSQHIHHEGRPSRGDVMSTNHKTEKTYWVSDCCLAETATSRPIGSMTADSPPDPITYCLKCGLKCDEGSYTYQELIEEKKKRKGHHGLQDLD